MSHLDTVKQTYTPPAVVGTRSIDEGAGTPAWVLEQAQWEDQHNDATRVCTLRKSHCRPGSRCSWCSTILREWQWFGGYGGTVRAKRSRRR